MIITVHGAYRWLFAAPSMGQSMTVKCFRMSYTRVIPRRLTTRENIPWVYCPRGIVVPVTQAIHNNKELLITKRYTTVVSKNEINEMYSGCQIYVNLHTLTYTHTKTVPVADPGFLVGGCQPRARGTKSQCTCFENCVEMKNWDS